MLVRLHGASAHRYRKAAVQSTPEPSVSVPEPQPEAFEDTPAKAELNIPEGLPKALRDLMQQNNVDESDIRLAVSQKGHFTYDTPMTNYPPDYIDGVLIAAWDQVYAIVKENQKVPF